jgi:formylglycine-generating enzyme required for sulfatase activity
MITKKNIELTISSKFRLKQQLHKTGSKIVCLFLLSIILFPSSTKANNLDIGTPSLSATEIIFTIQWDNSWKVATGPTNWDGVWVFIKKQNCADNIWSHALVSTTSTDHSVTGGVLQVDAVTDGMGVFIRRTATGMGNIASATVTLTLQSAPDAAANYQVYGTEVVNIPKGNFYLGDNSRGSNNWGHSQPTAPYAALLIDSTTQANGLGARSNYNTQNFGSTGSLPSTFPLGWNSYYCMKYEISQEQYTAFLNCLTYDQQTFRTRGNPNATAGTYAIAPATNNRNVIAISTPGVPNNVPAIYATTLPNLPCNYLNWEDFITFLDWAALRPMTEFEFEKTCRGPLTPIISEKAWGTTNLTQASSNNLANTGTSNEASNNSGLGLCAYGYNSSTGGPIRSGFAATNATTRVQAGSSYYGVLDMSGNVFEQCIGGYNYDFSTFTTQNGDGEISIHAVANTPNWPPNGGGTAGGVLRGGDWQTGSSVLGISDRGYMNQTFNQARDSRVGGRGVRSW